MAAHRIVRATGGLFSASHGLVEGKYKLDKVKRALGLGDRPFRGPFYTVNDRGLFSWHEDTHLVMLDHTKLAPCSSPLSRLRTTRSEVRMASFSKDESMPLLADGHQRELGSAKSLSVRQTRAIFTMSSAALSIVDIHRHGDAGPLDSVLLPLVACPSALVYLEMW